MTKVEYIRAIANKTGYSQRDVAAVFDAMGEIVVDVVKSGDTVRVVEGVNIFGIDAPEAVRRNPSTGETFVVPAHRKAKVRFTPSFKEAVKE